MSLTRMISRAKTPTSMSKLASYSYHLVLYLTAFYKPSLMIFFPTSDSDCSHVICRLPVHKYYMNSQKRSSHSGERESQHHLSTSHLLPFSVIKLKSLTTLLACSTTGYSSPILLMGQNIRVHNSAHSGMYLSY